jgi:PAS domain S-box-containing protein
VRADERFVRVLEEMQAAAFIVDRDSERVLYANRRMLQMFGTGPEQLPGRVLRWCKSAADRADGGHPPAQEPDGWTAFRSEECRDPATGRWYLVQAGPIPWSGRRSAGLRVLTDITDRRHAQAMRREHQEMLRRTARLSALAETTSALAHEINQPLMAIASYCDACLRLLPDDPGGQSELAQALKKSRAQAIRASSILRRMRDFVRSKHTQPALCEMNGIIDETLELLETRIADEGVSVDVALAHRLAPLHADRFLLVQVVANLLENAIDAVRSLAPDARRIFVATETEADGGIHVSIADCGPGIPATVAERLYTPFVSNKEHGLGLGLSICRSVVEAHGGRLWHGERPGGGAIFHFVVTGAA